MEYFRLSLYIIFGVLPSLVWLFYYLRKDLHPEPKKMILKIFLLGSLVTIPTFFIQIGLATLLPQLLRFVFFDTHPVIINILKWFVVIALTEETLKYIIVKMNIFDNAVLDEPLDIMLYMVVVALGFAAVENMLYLFSPVDGMSFGLFLQTTILISFIRFIGATFLHTLCSAILGYFIALSFSTGKKGVSLTLIGLTLAVFLHGLYDFSIITLAAPFNFLIPVMIILGLALFVIYAFNKTKTMKSVGKV